MGQKFLIERVIMGLVYSFVLFVFFYHVFLNLCYIFVFITLKKLEIWPVLVLMFLLMDFCMVSIDKKNPIKKNKTVNYTIIESFGVL